MKISPTACVSSAILAAFALLALSSCASGPTVTDVWTAPDLSQISFKKIMAVATTKDGGVRRIAEDAMAAAVPSIQCIPSYAMLPGDADIKEATNITASLKAAAFDGIVVMRMISDRSEVNVSQNMAYPTGYGSFGGYYGGYAMRGYGYGTGYGMGMGYSSTTVTTDRIISIETNVYEFPGEKLVWSGVTTVTSPGNIQELITAAAGAIRKQMVKQKLIPAPAK